MAKPVQLDFGLIVVDPEAHRRQQKVKDRRCLSCSRMFLSAGPHNRVCMKCRDLDAWSSAPSSFSAHCVFYGGSAMPDTMIQTETAGPPASCGVMSGYRSPGIGTLVAARAKSAAKIKSIIKDKFAKVESRKEGGRSYSYQYADLADVLDAVGDALAENGLAIFQTTQDRGRDGTYLLTTLAHESDQWVAGEIRLRNTEGGPQVLGSELTYLRRYAVLSILALAPEADDDGKAAQDRADQQARQRPERPARTDTPKTQQATQAAPGVSGEPVLMQIPLATNGELLIGKWVAAAKAALDGKREAWRREWLQMHEFEMDEVRKARRDWADKLVGMAIAPDLAAE